MIAQTVYDKYYSGAFQSDISTYYDEDVDIPEVTMVEESTCTIQIIM